jgi:hypothetical protein
MTAKGLGFGAWRSALLLATLLKSVDKIKAICKIAKILI